MLNTHLGQAEMLVFDSPVPRIVPSHKIIIIISTIIIIIIFRLPAHQVISTQTEAKLGKRLKRINTYK